MHVAKRMPAVIEAERMARPDIPTLASDDVIVGTPQESEMRLEHLNSSVPSVQQLGYAAAAPIASASTTAPANAIFLERELRRALNKKVVRGKSGHSIYVPEPLFRTFEGQDIPELVAFKLHAGHATVKRTCEQAASSKRAFAP